MIDNTLSSIEKITGQLKAMNRVRQFLTFFLYSAYLIYRIVVNNGNLVLNIVLLALTLMYASFYIYYISTDKKSFSPKSVAIIKRVYRWSRHILTAIGVGLNVSSFLLVANQPLTVSNLIFAIIMPVFLVFQIIFDIVYEYAMYCFRLLKNGVVADVENIKEKYQKPIEAVRGVKNTIDGFKNVKEGVLGLASSIFKKKKSKKAPPPKEEDLNEVAAEEQAEIVAPEQVELLPPPEEKK